MRTKQIVSSLALIIISALFAVTADAVVVIDGGPAFPGSANITGATFSGPVASTGGNTGIYPNISSSSVAKLYFGLGGDSGFSMDGGVLSGDEFFAWYADTASTIEYRGSTVIPLVSGSQTVTTRLLLTASGATVVSDAVTHALPSGAHSLFDVALSAGSFVVNRRIEAFNASTSSWEGANNFFNSQSTISPCGGPCTGTNLNTGFYWEDNSTAVPEPASLALLSLGLFGLGFRRSRLLR